MMSFSDGELDDNDLMRLTHQIPKRAIILFEDIDSAGIRREFDNDSALDDVAEDHDSDTSEEEG